jgi:hypothetical protein
VIDNEASEIYQFPILTIMEKPVEFHSYPCLIYHVFSYNFVTGTDSSYLMGICP